MSARRESPRLVTHKNVASMMLIQLTQLFAALSETLHNQVRLVAAEKNEMTEEAQRIITTIKQMDVSINGPKDRHEYEAEDEDLRITTPLILCLQALKEKHLQISRIHKERFEQVKSPYNLILCNGSC
jgi:protein regulator of cytokinesis 1